MNLRVQKVASDHDIMVARDVSRGARGDRATGRQGDCAAKSLLSGPFGVRSNAAEEVAKQQATQSQEPPESVIIVEVLGYGCGE